MYKSRRPKTGLKYVRLLHDNSPVHKARIVTDFFGFREGYRPSAPSVFARLGPLRLFSLSKTQISFIWKEIHSKNALGPAVY